MKTNREVRGALDDLVRISTGPSVSLDQYSVIAAMVSALGWVLEDPDCVGCSGTNPLATLLERGHVWTPEEN